MIKQLIFCYKENRKLLIRCNVLTDVFIPTEDVISPQKTTLTIKKTDKVELNDIVIIRDNNSGKIEYIGYIDTLTNKTNTEISCYPLINVFDNDYVLDQMFEKSTNEDGTEVDIEVDVVYWLITQLTRAFIDTDDNLQALPLIVRNYTNKPVLYKRAIDTPNLFEVYIDLFINTGVYIVFNELSYNLNEIDGIYCDIYCNTDEKPYYLRCDNPQVQNIDIVDNTFTNYNKIIATQEISEEELGKNPDLKPQRYYFYLLNDNSITRNPNDERRIKQVRSKEITFSLNVEGEDEIDKDETLTEEQKEEEKNRRRANALLLAVYNELQAPEYNLQITIDMLKNDNIRLYRSVDFLAESGIIYSSNITKIEKLSDLQIRITLGALRNSLTDFKKKVEAI